MNEEYVLKFKASKNIVILLNEVNKEHGPVVAMMNAIEESTTENLDELQDWLDALKSGKKIVNPISPREELIARIHDVFGSNVTEYANGFYRGAYAALDCAAKEHPAIKDWLRSDSADIADWSKYGDSNA